MIAALVTATAPSATQADERAPLWQGVWQGTLGQADVRLCLQDSGAGAYYYEKYLKPITLERKDGNDSAGEVALAETIDAARDRNAAPPQATLRLQAERAGQRLHGSWQLAGRTLPVQLQRVPVQGPDQSDDEACGSDAFNQALERPARVVAQAATTSGTAYRKLTLDFGDRYTAQVASFALVRSGPAAERVNKALREDLHATEQMVFECSRGQLASNGWPGELDAATSPVFIGAHWMITTTHSEDDCGGAHPNSSTRYAVWNLDSGEPADPWQWFAPKAVRLTLTGTAPAQGEEVELLPPLRQLLVEFWPRKDDEDCAEVATDSDEWMPYPSPRGMVFVPVLPHVMVACTDEALVPWQRLRALLGAGGRKAVDAFLQDAAARAGK